MIDLLGGKTVEKCVKMKKASAGKIWFPSLALLDLIKEFNVELFELLPNIWCFLVYIIVEPVCIK